MSSSKKKKPAGSRATIAALRTGKAAAPHSSAAAAGVSSISIAAAAPIVSSVAAATAAAVASPSSHSRHSSATPFGSRQLFLTVGTTRFDALISALNDEAEGVVAWMAEAGFSRAILQIGTGTVEPLQLRDAATRWSEEQKASSSASSSSSAVARRTLQVEWFRHSPDLLSFVSRSDLVISHAGAGSILESLRRARPLLVVINDTLMHNHQAEVADALAEGHFLYKTTPKELLSTLRKADWTPPVEEALSLSTSDDADSSSTTRYQLLRYPPVQTDAFPQLLDDHVSQVLRPASSTAALTPFLFTTLLPAALALAITWTVFL